MNLQIILIFLLIFMGLFIKPFNYGVWDFIYKFILFIGTTYLLYKNLIQNNSEKEDDFIEPKFDSTMPMEMNDEEDIPFNLHQLLTEDNSSKQYIIDQFTALASILLPDQGWIFHRYNEQKLDVIEYISFSEFELEDIPKQIDLNGIFKIIDQRNETLIENNIQNANYSFQYYSESEYTVSSFLCVPILISNSDKLFFIYDSATQEQFNKDDIEIINKIANGVHSTLKFRLKSISLHSELKLNSKLLEFALIINQCNTISSAIDRLAEFVSTQFEADRLTICSLAQNSDKAVIRKVIGQQDIFSEEYEFLLEEGLTGWVIGKNKPYLIDDLEKGEYFIPRYSKEEKTNYGLRSFLGIPFSINDTVYGAITLEDQTNEKYSAVDKNYLQKITRIFATIYKRKQINKQEN